MFTLSDSDDNNSESGYNNSQSDYFIRSIISIKSESCYIHFFIPIGLNDIHWLLFHFISDGSRATVSVIDTLPSKDTFRRSQSLGLKIGAFLLSHEITLDHTHDVVVRKGGVGWEGYYPGVRRQKDTYVCGYAVMDLLRKNLGTLGPLRLWQHPIPSLKSIATEVVADLCKSASLLFVGTK